MNKKRILFVADAELASPRRGTPLRIVHMLEQIVQSHELIICTKSCDVISGAQLVSYPVGSRSKRLHVLTQYIKQHSIDIVLTATESNIKLPILLKLRTGVKIAIDLHGLDHEELLFAGKITYLKAVYMRLRTQLLLLFYDHVFAVSQKLLTYYRGIKNKSTPIYGGVDLESFKPLPRTTHQGFVIGYMGNNRPYQGWQALLDAMENPDLRLSDGPRLRLIMSGDENEIRGSLSGRNISASIDLHCNVPHEAVNGLVADCDVLVIPRPSLRLTEYAYPSKLPEYLATGIATIVTRVGPVRELPDMSQAAIVIDSHDIPSNLVTALNKLVKMSETERNAIGLSGRTYVQQYLNWDVIGQTLNQSLANL